MEKIIRSVLLVALLVAGVLGFTEQYAKDPPFEAFLRNPLADLWRLSFTAGSFLCAIAGGVLLFQMFGKGDE